ncbi:hypothetical protein [Deinococcus peraridilitoris]|uniref:Uncharacterized protein n=1 Tax=Deinococcus peraridilitoris (strain DSM 19664 / LMG 22246 / CIP 109416 / KR-200) TaxID=937777 RepID=L0A3D3_DEIPD|nr:hypothetical protein [Deinococcus peraridilitoris]AFZ67677.1 hypothetical protein Deipe_2192 [Deinococcus peraridilitoris DSM 19664]
MSGESPSSVFQAAQAALEAGDWERFFACLSDHDLRLLARNSLLSLWDDEQLPALLHRHAIPAELSGHFTMSLTLLVAHAERRGRAKYDGGQQRRLVGEVDRSCKAMLRAVPDLAGFTAALERLGRACGRGGSVSSSLFLGEELREVLVQGARAWGRRMEGGMWGEDLGFVRQKNGWRIRLRARHPGCTS